MREKNGVDTNDLLLCNNLLVQGLVGVLRVHEERADAARRETPVGRDPFQGQWGYLDEPELLVEVENVILEGLQVMTLLFVGRDGIAGGERLGQCRGGLGGRERTGQWGRIRFPRRWRAGEPCVVSPSCLGEGDGWGRLGDCRTAVDSGGIWRRGVLKGLGRAPGAGGGVRRGALRWRGEGDGLLK